MPISTDLGYTHWTSVINVSSIMYSNDAYLGRRIPVGGGSDVTAGVYAGTLSVHVRLGRFPPRS